MSQNNCCSTSTTNNADCCNTVNTASTGCCTNTIMTASATLSYKDYFGAWKVRWGIGRMSYSVVPGLYALGTPNFTSPVLVSANYKLTFDTLRKNLTGLDCWILILDTKGVNVWCAAGKGTFGTEELINRIKQTKLTEIVAHRRLILPQLGASGVNSNEVSRRSGFTVVFGPVRASDIKEFLSSGNKATRDMRTVKFTLWDRLVLTPMELVASIKVSMIIFGVLFLLNLFANRPFGALDLLLYITALLIGTVLTPALLPLIPGKAFAFKGWLLGAISTGYILWTNGWLTSPFLLLGIGYMLAMPAYSAFLAMNFTGASTYTSPSGVLKEMKIALPFIAVSLVVGIVLILIKTIMG